jgi:hypothetical protein
VLNPRERSTFESTSWLGYKLISVEDAVSASGRGCSCLYLALRPGGKESIQIMRNILFEVKQPTMLRFKQDTLI